MRRSLVLVDDHEIVRAGATKFLADRFDIVGEAGDVTEAIALISALDPDGALVDVRLPSGTGDEVIAAAKKTGVRTRFLALSVSAERADVVRMLQAGVDGYLLKSTLGDELPELVDEMLDGGRPVSPQIAGFMLDIDETAEDSPEIENLTAREREVVRFIARGYSYRRTASAMFVSPKTIEAHMSHIFKKLGVASRHELSIEAYRSGWIPPDIDGTR
jgi:DNA-binding NarL/FixJ family response regulator